MAATGSPSHPQPTVHDDEKLSQNQDPNPTQPQNLEQSPPQSSQYSETLDLPNSTQSPSLVQTSQQSDKHEDSLLLLEKRDRQSGTIHSTLPEPIVLTDDTDQVTSPPPPVTSPTNVRGRGNKRKKGGGTRKRKRPPTKKMQNLTSVLNPIPFVPKKPLDVVKYEDVLQRLGLHDFSKIEFDKSLRTDLIAQLIVNYDAKKRCSYVNDLRINLNRADLARALKLPPAKQDRGSSSVDEVDLDSEVFSDEALGFIQDFVANWMVLCDGSLAEIVNWTRCIRDGHPEKLDPASLIWYTVEKELNQGDKLVDCYYAPHLQYLIRYQKPSFFKDDGEEHVIADEEKEDEKEEKEEKYEKEETDEKEEKEETYEKEETEEKAKDENELKDEKEEKEEENASIVQEQNIELNLGTVVEEIAPEEVVKDDGTMMEAEECKEEMEEQVDLKNVMGDHLLQRCQSSDLNNFAENKVQEVEDEEVEHVEDEDEQVEQVEDEEEEEEEEEERMDEGFDMEANDDSFDRDGLTDNFLQGVEPSHNPYNSHGLSSMDLFGSRDGSFMSHGGPSFYNNGGKRVMEPEEDDDIHHLDQNSKRLKTDETWDQKQNDIGHCFDQMQQWMQKAKMIHDSKERSYENLQYNQQMAMDQLQERQQIMEMVIKSKDEELEKKHAEVFRLERELYLMGDLLAGYRKALNDTRFKFSEYRKRFALKEEPLYKDAGPGGLVLSTREIEKQRLKQEEDMMKFQHLAKNIEEDYVYQLEMQNSRLSPMVDKLVFIANEVQRLKEIATQPKGPSVFEPEETQKLVDEDEKNQKSMDVDESSCVEPEKDQKSMDGDESSFEPKKNQKSMDEDKCTIEPEMNQKSMDVDKSSVVEPEKNQGEIPEHAAASVEGESAEMREYVDDTQEEYINI